MIRVFADASVKASIVRAMREQSVEVLYGLETDHDASDLEVLAKAKSADAILITEDTDLANSCFETVERRRESF